PPVLPSFPYTTLFRSRHAATSALLVRNDVIIVASVSAIYGLGSPEQYRGQLLRLVRGVEYPMGDAIRRLVDIQYERNEVNLVRGDRKSTRLNSSHVKI